MSRKKMTEQASFIRKQERRTVLNKEVLVEPGIKTQGYIANTKFRRPVGNWTGKEKEYIDAVWKANSQYITSKGLTEKKFKLRVKNIMEEDKLSPRRAITEYGRTRQFMTREEIGMENIQKSMTKEQAKAIKELMGGDQRKKINYEGFVWDKERQMWVDASGKVGLKYCYPDDSLTESIVELQEL